MNLRRHALRLFMLASLLFLVMCRSDPAARGGLVVVVANDGSLAMDRFAVTILDRTQEVLMQQDFDVPKTPLPNTISIVSNGKIGETVSIAITAFDGPTAVDRRDAIIRQIPVDRVVSFAVDLSARCTAFVTPRGTSTCAAGQTCNPTTASCGGSDVDATALPTYAVTANVADASVIAPKLAPGCSAPADCPHQTCIAGACQGECGPGETTCSGSTVKSCGADGHWSVSQDLTAPLWTQYYGVLDLSERGEPAPTTLAYLANGDAVMVGAEGEGQTQKGYVVSFSPANGAQKWVAQAGYVAGTVAATPDGGAMVCGYALGGASGCTSLRYCGYCTKVDANGNRGPEQLFTQPDQDIDIVDVLATKGTSFYAAGRSTQTDPYYNLTLQSMGTPGTTSVFPNASSPVNLTSKPYQDEILDLELDADGTLYAGGYLGVFGSCARYYLAHLSVGTAPAVLQEVQGPCLGSTDPEPRNGLRAVVPLGDGTVLVAGSQYVGGGQDVDAVVARWKFMENGVAVTPAPVWSKTFGGAGWEVFNALVRLPDGGLLLVGSTSAKTEGSSDPKRDILVVRTDDVGNVIWNKTYGGAGDDLASAVKRTADGKYLITGQAAPAGADLTDLYAFTIPAVCP